MRGLCVTGTDTDVGKTVLSAALAAAMVAAGERVRAHKPALTGLDVPAGRWPRDHELLAAVTGGQAEEVAPLRYGPAVSPALAATLAGEPGGGERILAAALAAREETLERDGVLLLEGAGGLLSPLAASLTLRDLARALELPLLIAARTGLGTINHTLLTVEAARSAGLEVRAVVLTPWPREPATLERSNRETIAELGAVEVHGLAPVRRPDARLLAQAGAALPWRRWLGL